MHASSRNSDNKGVAIDFHSSRATSGNYFLYFVTKQFLNGAEISE